MHVDFYKNIEPPNLGGKKKRISDYIGSISHLVTTIINQLYIYIQSYLENLYNICSLMFQNLTFSPNFNILPFIACTMWGQVGTSSFFFFLFFFFYKNLNFTITNFSGQLNNNVYTLKNIQLKYFLNPLINYDIRL